MKRPGHRHPLRGNGGDGSGDGQDVGRHGHELRKEINDYVRKDLGVPAAKMPMNIDRFGNTSAATIPILIDEQTRAGNLKKGELNMLLALGAGIHWGCALVRW